MTSAGVLLADSDTGKGSPIGLLVVLVLVIAVYFLWRSMNRHLKKVQPPPEEQFEAQFRSTVPAESPTDGPSEPSEPPEPIENGQQPPV